MTNFIFTFGQGHISKKGIPMRNYWIKVVAENEAKAREIFIAEFTTIEMNDPMEFAFSYTEKSFIEKCYNAYYPDGEYLCIKQTV